MRKRATLQNEIIENKYIFQLFRSLWLTWSQSMRGLFTHHIQTTPGRKYIQDVFYLLSKSFFIYIECRLSVSETKKEHIPLDRMSLRVSFRSYHAQIRLHRCFHATQRTEMATCTNCIWVSLPITVCTDNLQSPTSFQTLNYKDFNQKEDWAKNTYWGTYNKFVVKVVQ